MKKLMLWTTLALLIGCMLIGIAYGLTRNQRLYVCAITFGTTFYHFAMRLSVAFLINLKFHNHMDDTKRWFQERRFETKFYKIIGVRNWKNRLPTFQPEDFRLKKHAVVDMIQVTCQAEIIHEVIMVLSFVPVLFSIWFGAVGVFFTTSCMSFLFDSVFVIAQRYNRPRLIRFMKNDS